MQKKIYERNNYKYQDWEIEYINDNWGIISITKISNYLKRSPYALIRYCENHQIGGAYTNSLYLTLNEVAKILNVDVTTIHKVWIPNFNFPVIKKKYNVRFVYRVDIDKLLNWCKYNQDRFSTINMEKYALGKEPDWLIEKRKRDFNSIPARQEWSEALENQLLQYVIKGLSNKEIAIKMNRTDKSISRKKCRLIKDGRLKEMINLIQNNMIKASC